jgi:hypothetical protein
MRRKLLLSLPLVFVLLMVSHETMAQHPRLDVGRVLAVYQYLPEESMKEAYGSAYGISVQYLPAIGDELLGGRLAVCGEMGLIVAPGEPIVTDAAWMVESSDMVALVMPLGGSVLYTLTGDASGSSTSYAGIGVVGFLGIERMEVKASRPGLYWDTYEWHDTCFRASIGGEALVGTKWKVHTRVSIVGEVSWLQCGRGSIKRGSVAQEELAQGWGEAFAAFQPSNFDFTGVKVAVGAEW